MLSVEKNLKTLFSSCYYMLWLIDLQCNHFLFQNSCLYIYLFALFISCLETHFILQSCFTEKKETQITFYCLYSAYYCHKQDTWFHGNVYTIQPTICAQSFRNSHLFSGYRYMYLELDCCWSKTVSKCRSSYIEMNFKQIKLLLS